MEKTIKSLNIVAAALLIVNLAVELWDRFRPQKQKTRKRLSMMKMAPKKSTTKKKSTNEKGNIIDIIAIGLETIATIIKQSKKIWQAYQKMRPPS